MPFLRPLFLSLLLGCSITLPSFAAEPPSSAQVQQSLDQLAERKLPEAEHKALQARLEQTLALLAARDDSQQRLEALKRQLREAPSVIAAAQRELNRLKATAPVEVAKRYAKSSVPQLEQLLAERSSQLNGWQQELAEANSLLITAQTRPERAQAEISANQSRSLQINDLLKSGKEGGKPLPAEQRDQLAAEQAQLEAQTELRRQ